MEKKVKAGKMSKEEEKKVTYRTWLGTT